MKWVSFLDVMFLLFVCFCFFSLFSSFFALMKLSFFLRPDETCQAAHGGPPQEKKWKRKTVCSRAFSGGQAAGFIFASPRGCIAAVRGWTSELKRPIAPDSDGSEN